MALSALLGWTLGVAAGVGPAEAARADEPVCTTSWAAPINGLWGDPTKWTNGVPGAGIACITVAGTYQVTVAGNAGTETLVLGGTSGTQTIIVAAGAQYCCINDPEHPVSSATDAYFALKYGGTVNAHGVIRLTGLASPASPAVAGGIAALIGHPNFDGTLTMGGTVETNGGGGGPRAIEDNIINQGTIAIGANTSYSSPAPPAPGLTNQSQFTVAEGATFSTGGNKTHFVNDVGGHITNNGVFHASGGMTPPFLQGEGTSSGNPIIADGVQYLGAGTSTIEALGDIHGDLAAGQTLLIESGHVNTDVAAIYFLPATVAGTIRLFSGGGGGGGTAALYGVAANDTDTDALTIAPTGHLVVDPDGGGNRQIYRAHIVNQGQVDINYDTTMFGSSHGFNSFVNEGTLNVVPGFAFHMNADNLLLNQPTGRIVVHGALWNERPVTNAGRITLAPSDAAHGVNFAAGTLTNSGTVIDDPSGGGTRTIQAPVTNEGTMKLRATAGTPLAVTGSYTQTAAGTTQVAVAGNTSFGHLAATGAMTLGGTLRVDSTGTQTPGHAFAILSAASRTATFATQVYNGTTYTPGYGPTGVTLFAGRARPDGRIRLGTSGAFVGNDVYNTTGAGQTRSGSAARRRTVTYDVSVQNDAPFADTLRLRGTAGTARYSVAYLVVTAGVPTDVTGDVVAGTYTTPSLAPGATHKVRVVVTVNAGAPAGSSLSATMMTKSTTDTSRKDTVAFVTSRS